MAGYAILRFEKIKSIGDLKRLALHHERNGSDVENARKPYDARVFSGSGDMVSDVLSRLPEKRKSDNVLAMEFLLTTSPESQRINGEISAKLDPQKVKKLEQAAKEFLEKEFGGTATARIHYDEKTPHIQGFIVPNEGWNSGSKLVAKHLFSPKTLADYQTRWHETCAKAGLDVQRGDVGSQAKHEAIQRYYARVAAPIPKPPQLAPEPPLPTPKDKLKEVIGLDTDHKKSVLARKKSEENRAEFLEKNYKHAVQNAKESKAGERLALDRAKKAEAQLLASKKQTDALRALPLTQVLEMLGCERHKSEALRWHTPAGDVWVEKSDGARFNSFDDEALKGRGAIDLVMKINGSTFSQATAFLAGQYGVEATVRDAAGLLAESASRHVQKALQDVPEPSPLPTPHPGRLERVAAYLTQARGIPVAMVATMIKAGRLYADKFANAVFLTDDRAGCEIRGTGPTPFHGQRGQKTGHTVEGDPTRVVIVESAIEAMSCTSITGMTSVSVGGANLGKAAEIARSWLQKGATVFAGQNADKDGEKQAVKLIEQVPGVARLQPRFGVADWNDALQITKAEPDSPSVRNHLLKTL